MFTKRKFPNTRLRRLRSKPYLRDLVRENNLTANDLIQPLFIKEDLKGTEIIEQMPGILRYGIDSIVGEITELVDLGIKSVALFPVINANKKDADGSEAINNNNLLCTAIKEIKSAVPEIIIISDVALDPYTSHGHDGLLKKDYVLNDETIKILIDQSLLQAQMGCDVLAPSDMMDGRIGEIRKALDSNGFEMTQILSYAVKYASSFYGPFRDAVGSKGLLKGNKKNYQMDFRNSNEALREVALDIKEGADMVMVKPGLPYLDIIKLVKENFKIPVMAYQVSGEYSLLENGIKKGLANNDIIIESLIAFKRAGANAIVSYYADRLDAILK